MHESVRRVERAARSIDPYEQRIARRVLETPSVRRAWTTEHFALMQSVAAQRRPGSQVTALRGTSVKLIHRKATFEYMQSRNLAPGERRRALALFHPSRSFTDALVAEHGQYLRSACSFLCTSHLGNAVVGDRICEDSLLRYEELYSDYFRAFCDVALATDPAEEVDQLRALLPYLKHQVAQLRRAIIALPLSAPALLNEARLRQPTGDTVRLRRPPFKM